MFFLLIEFNIYITKAWSPTVVVPRHEALALPEILELTTRSPRRI